MAVEKVLGLATAALATEHFFTFSLSSLPSTKQFFSDTPEHKQDVRTAYMIAAGLSLSMAIIIAVMLKDPTAVITTVVLSAIFIFLYEKALSGTII
jgi:hypothetical protein